MTPTREELLAQRAEIDAKLAALDAEPDWEAWRAALDAFYAANVYDGCLSASPLDDSDKVNIRGLIAALPLAPAASLPMGEEMMDVGERIAGRLCDWSLQGEAPVPLMHEAAAFIRETLRRSCILSGDPA
jgi:hypothetical protein